MTTTKNAMQPFCPPPSNAWQTIRLRLCDGFYVRLVAGVAVVSFILDYEQLLIIFICAAKFILVVILATTPLPTPLCYLPDQQQQQTHVLLACFSCCFSCFPRFVAPPLLLPRVLFVCLSLLSVCLYVCVFVWLCTCAWIWRQSRRHFQDILLAFVVPFIAFAFAFAFSFAAHLSCCCLSRILTWSILAICWSTIISVRAEKKNKIHSWYIKSAANLRPDFHIFLAHNARGYYNLVYE